MYEMYKNNLTSFVMRVESIAERMKCDQNGLAFLDIKSFERIDNYYRLIGVAKIELSPLCMEKVHFRMKVQTSKDRIVIKNEQVSKVVSNTLEFLPNASDDSKIETIDTFTLHNKKNGKYLVHSSDNEIKKIYHTSDDYRLSSGFPSKNFEVVSLEKLKEKPKKHKHTKIKSLIKKWC